jgi:hypothetical protein
MAASHPHRPEFHEGPEAAQRAESAMRRIITVSKTELERREAAHKKSRGTKKTRPSRDR